MFIEGMGTNKSFMYSLDPCCMSQLYKDSVMLYVDSVCGNGIGGGINEVIINNHVSISPNPTNATIQITIDNYSSKFYTIEILDLLGNELANEKLDANITNYNFEKENKGIYFLVVRDANNNLLGTEKIVLE